jgi:hypothetical protein
MHHSIFSPLPCQTRIPNLAVFLSVQVFECSEGTDAMLERDTNFELVKANTYCSRE